MQATKPDLPAHFQYAAVWACYERGLSAALQQQGQVPLSRAERGRATTMEVTVAKNPPAPPRKSCKGEIAPAFLGSSAKHAHWFRQARRLQSLIHYVRKASTSTAAAVRRADTWHAIVNAPGFAGGLCSWWASRPLCTFGAPEALPVSLPDAQTLEAIAGCFEGNLRRLEKELLHETS